MQRHARHIALPQVGADGQSRIGGSTALIVGLGGIGCATASYLACAGVGQLQAWREWICVGSYDASPVACQPERLDGANAGVTTCPDARAEPYAPKKGKVHPPIVLPTLEHDRSVALSSFRGKKVLLIHFASW